MTNEDDTEDMFYEFDDRAVIGANVARTRKELGMSQTALAEAMRDGGMTHWRQNTVSRIETGKQELSLREVQALGGILGDVTTGTTPIPDETRLAFGRAVNKITVRKLQTIEASLTQALDDVQRLRAALSGSTGGE